MKVSNKVKTFLWGEPPATEEERKLLRKIDAAVLSYVCLMYWSNYLNRMNFASAYVSGLQEDLSFTGNQFNQVNTIFTIGYIIGQVPNNLMLQIVAPHLWLPGMALIWAGLSMCMAGATKPQHIMVIRFFQAIAESSTFSGGHWILGSWYKDGELGKRAGIFASSAQLGSLFSGVFQAQIFKSMDGLQGLPSWKWLFLIDGFIGITIAIYGYLIFPDIPNNTKSWFLSPSERALAINRLPQSKSPKTFLSWDLWKRCLVRWHWYAFSALFAWSSMLESVGINSLFALWLKDEGRTIPERNHWPLSQFAVAITSTMVVAWITDYYRCRWPVGPYMSTVMIFLSILLLIWTIPFGLKFFAFSLSGVSYSGQGALFAWANVVCIDDEQERAVVLASMNLWSNVINSFWSITLYPADDAPRFKKGFIAMICVAVLTVIITMITRHLDNRERALKVGEKHEKTKAQGRPESGSGSIESTEKVGNA